MPKFKHYTAALVERQIKAIIRRNPDNVNPQDSSESCLYHQGRGRNLKRCLIGQWAFEQGFTTPFADDGPVRELVEDLWSSEAKFDDDAVSRLTLFQRSADVGENSYDPAPWKELLSLP